MKVVVPQSSEMIRVGSLEEAFSGKSSGGGQIWVNGDLTDQEKSNLDLVSRFWDVWKAVPFDMSALRECFAPNVTVRTGWRGEHVIAGREEALAMYAGEIQRQTDHGEITEFRFPVVVAKGPVVFHTWIWIARSERLGYHIERPMAASYLITDGRIERWDSYCTGPESAPGYVGGDGPDGL